MTDVTRKRTTIWLGGDVHQFDVHTEDDMVMIEAQHGGTDEIEVLICPELFPAVRAAIETLERRSARA